MSIMNTIRSHPLSAAGQHVGNQAPINNAAANGGFGGLGMGTSSPFWHTLHHPVYALQGGGFPFHGEGPVFWRDFQFASRLILIDAAHASHIGGRERLSI